MRLQMLGGGNNQCNAIKKARSMGHEVILTDYLEDPPGKAYAQVHEKVSTFDWEGNLAVAKKYRVDGIMTTGTDQPVLTVAKVAQALDLPRFLDVATAEAVTHKKIMKETFQRHGIPTVPFGFLREEGLKLTGTPITYPGVLKPLDSQGQRGVFIVDDWEQAEKNLPETLSFSGEKEALLEEFYPGDEVTVSAWVQRDQTYFLTLTDRKTFRRGKHIGICYAHDYPSRFQETHEKEIRHWTDAIRQAFSISRGPLYIQMLIGEKGIRVNEVACRIGGAYEEVFIPHITGFDLLEWVIEFSLTGAFKEVPPLHRNQRDMVTAQLFFARSGSVGRIGDLKAIKALPGMLDAGYNVGVGDTLGTIENATARAGYMVVAAQSKQELDQRVDAGYRAMGLWNDQNENLVLQGDPQSALFLSDEVTDNE